MSEVRRTATSETRPKPPNRPCVLDVIAAYPQLNTAAVVVLLILDGHAFGDRTHCWPSVPRIAALVRKHERTVQRALRALEAAGLIAVEEADTRTGRRYVLLYRVPTGDAHVTGGDKSATSPVPPMSLPGDIRVVPPVTSGSPKSLMETTTKPQHQTVGDDAAGVSRHEDEEEKGLEPNVNLYDPIIDPFDAEFVQCHGNIVPDWWAGWAKLRAEGITPDVADELAQTRTYSEIVQQIRWLEARGPRDRQATLVAAIRGRWPQPTPKGASR